MTVDLNTWLEKNRWQKRLLALAATLCLFFAFSYLYDQHDTDLPQYGDNVWFQGDIGRVYGNMNNRLAFGHYRAKVHPLYSLQTYPPTFVLKNIFSDDAKAIKYVTVGIATLWLYCLYRLLRLMGCIRTDAFVFSLLGMSSSAALFWLSVSETYALGSISIMLALTLTVISQHRKVPDRIYAIVSAFTFSVTVTNWMAGVFSTFTSLPFKRAVKVSVIALLAVTLLWGLQKLIFPTSGFFIGESEEHKFLFAPTMARLGAVLNTFFFHSTITPALNITQYNQFNWPMLSMQSSAVGSSGTLGALASSLWSVMLGLGAWSLFTCRLSNAFKLTLGLTLLCQFLLHSIYGEETFLYTLHFLPLLIVLTALTTLTQYRKIAMTFALALIPILLCNNLNQFYQATDTFKPLHHHNQPSVGTPSPS